jgi:hypothetical protein
MALTGKIAYLGEPLNYFRFHDASVSSRNQRARSDVAEHLQVVRWVLDRVTVSDANLAAIRERKARLWIPSLLTLQMPLGVRRLILKNARAIDPHATAKLVGPAVMAVGAKLRRVLFGARAGQALGKGAMPGE